MHEPSPETLAAARRFGTRLAAPGLSVPLARLYSERVRVRNRQAGLETWTSVEFQNRLLDAVKLVDAALVEPIAPDGTSPTLRRAGEILEWLSELDPDGTLPQLTTLAAACYQLAGYPARATGVLTTASEAARDSPLGLLVAGDLATLLAISPRLAHQRRRRVMRALRDEEDSDGPELVLPSIIASEVASAIGVICAELRWGDEARARAAVDKLRTATTVVAGLRDPYSWLAVRLAAEVADRILRSSLRGQITRFADTLPAGRDVLERYVRMAFASRRVVAWPSQIRGLDRLATGESFALCTPTGSGKTTIAEVALLDGLFRDPLEGELTFESNVSTPLCLYIVPTRALAAEVESKLSQVLRRAGGPRAVTITGLYGGTDWGPTDAWLSNDEPTVLICTQEKAEALVRFFGRVFLHRLRVVIVDEAHNVQHGGADEDSDIGDSRSLRLESLITRLRANLHGQGTRFIALSAVARQIERPLAQWISGSSGAEPVRSEYRSTRQLVGTLRCLSGGRFRISYDLLDGSQLTTGTPDARPYVPTPFPPHPPATGMEGPSKGMAPYALWAALHLASSSHGSANAVLISITQQVRNFANWCLELLEKQWNRDELPDYFAPPTNDADLELWDQCRSACADYFGAESREYRLLSLGIVVHHGKMPGRLPRLLVALLERRIVRIAVATSTLSEGVNLPFETVLVPGLRRYPGGPLTGREFGNLVGRAGRPGVSTEGQALVLMLETGINQWQRQNASADYAGVLASWTSAGASGAPRSALAELIEALRSAWVGDEASLMDWLEVTAPTSVSDSTEPSLDTLDALDAQLLAVIAELDEFGLSQVSTSREEQLRSVWRQSFAHYAAKEEQTLEEMFVRRGSAIDERIYRDAQTRRRYYRSSLPPRDAEELFSLAPRLRTQLEAGAGYAGWNQQDRMEYLLAAIELTAELKRFELRETIGRSKTPWKTVMRWWLSPTTAEQQPSETQVADWLSFADGEVSYRFNWAIGAVLGVICDESSDEDDPWLTPEQWETIGLPFIAIWLKDLIVWGTLEPVAAYLLARGGAVVRAEAEDVALGYYADARRTVPDDELLDPVAIRRWAAGLIPRRRGDGRLRAPERMPARLLRRFRDTQRDEEWRVVPVLGRRRLDWVDPAGYRLAVSDRPEQWDEGLAESADFVLQPRNKLVIARPYL